nr:glycosyltransferase [Pseudomonas aromaticivorans]
MGVSVIIPCWHDEACLARLLGQLAACAPPLQVVVVDAAQSEACRALCRQHGALWLASRPCRGAQLRQGAAQASHEALWFLHADAELCGDPLGALRAALGAGAVGGCFAFRFAGAPPWQGRLLAWLVNRRTRFGTPYGDQGLFARRGAYLAAGQHAPWPLFEEVPLVGGLRRLGAFRRLGPGVLVDPRRWLRDGWWRRSLRNRLLALGFALGVPVERLARGYRSRV